MPASGSRHLAPRVLIIAAGLVGTLPLALLIPLLAAGGGTDCAGSGGGTGIALLTPGAGGVVGATEYGGPGDPSSGTTGSSGADLLQEPDSYAELGGTSFATAQAMGGLPYGTPLRITWGRHSTIAEKRDIGLGGGPIDGRPRVIDLWWELAVRLGIPYERGRWSGVVRVERPPAGGAAAALGGLAPVTAASTGGTSAGCQAATGPAAPVATGQRAVLLPDGQASAPAAAPAVVRSLIAAGNQIAGRPYVWGGGHEVPLSQLDSGYDCSGSVSRILYVAGLLLGNWAETSGELESFGLPGPGRWVTIYASPDHVFMYVAGLRWDTHNAAGPGDGSTGIGWHPLVRDASGFVVRHPVGL
jgi:hypothetical protein